MRPQHIRLARPTHDLTRIVALYRDVLGLELLAHFHDHDGFDGVMLGQRGGGVHLEFTHEHGTGRVQVPSPEHLLVLYFEDRDWVTMERRIREAGLASVTSHNPYWDRHGITIEDPDGYRVVLHRGAWRPEARPLDA